MSSVDYRPGGLRSRMLLFFLAPPFIVLIAITLFGLWAWPMNGYRPVLLGLAGAGLVFMILAVLVGVRQITSPINRIVDVGHRIAQGDFGATASIDTGDELEEIAHHLNFMSTQLQEANNAAGRAKDLETINAIASSIRSFASLENALNTALGSILDTIVSHLKLDGGAILLLDRITGVVSLQSQNGFGGSLAQPAQIISFCKEAARSAIEESSPWVADAFADLGPGEQQIGLLAAPILLNDAPLGALILLSGDKKSLERRRALSATLGRYLGGIMENARLYEQAQKEIAGRKRMEEELRRANEETATRNRELTMLNRVLEAITSNQDSRSILETVCRELVLAFNGIASAAAIADETGTQLKVIAEYMQANHPSALGLTIPVEGNPATLYVLKNKVPLALSDAQHDILLAPVHELMRQRGVASLLLLPILANDQAIGTIGLDTPQHHQFTEAEIHLAASVAAVAGKALAVQPLH